MQENREKWLGIVLVPIVFLILILAVSLGTKKPEKAEEDYETIDVASSGEETYAERGYIKEKEFPQALQNLVASGLLTVDENTEEESTAKSTYEYLMDSKEVLQSRTGDVVSIEDGESRYCITLSYDEKKQIFTNEAYEKVAKVEQCGFTGFTDQFKQVEKAYQKLQKTEDNTSHMEWDIEYMIYNQEIGFHFYMLSPNEINMELQLNVNTMYIPQKYRTLIENVTQSGEYMLRASCVDTKKEVLTFGAANGVMSKGIGIANDFYEKSGSYFGDTTISFVFENGQVTEYYVTTNESKLQLSDADKKLIQTVAPGLKKSFSEHQDYTDNGNKLYIAK